MSRVLTYLGRFFIILAGYAAASLAASAFLNIVFIASAGFGAEAMPAMFARRVHPLDPVHRAFRRLFSPLFPSVPGDSCSPKILGKPRLACFYPLPRRELFAVRGGLGFLLETAPNKNVTFGGPKPF